MQEHDARIFRGAAIPTAAVGAAAAVASSVMAGVPGLVGAALAALLVLAFFAVSAFVIAWAGPRYPHLLLPIAFLVYTTKVGVLAVALVLFGGTTAFHHNSFALTALACVIAWLTGQAVAGKRVRRLTVEPVSEGDDDSGTADSAAGAGVGSDR
ncbi:hypothetical protein [Streptomonospora litoralis]|uniref:ATP synthase protein I n=1 Tax=Streptomonospora litoralis TaxID=2498135 RepID=A0A4P6Q2J5_9ACTN|nr:hypothetical protein [Streptomonospora litoralis]QBI52857.1 hypothetical protein EKD16_05255 [Streptomonospora litoralis]